VIGLVSGKRYIRTSIISARNNINKFISPMIYKGTANTNLVITWVKEMLLPNLKSNSILIWDNASIHKSKELKEIMEKEGHIMLFLPPYSPDLNPIEHKWNELKQRLRSCYDESMDFIANLIREINYMTE
jgi:transposase